MRKLFVAAVVPLVLGGLALVLAGCGPDTRTVTPPASSEPRVGGGNFKAAIQGNPNIPDNVKKQFGGK
jgi:hypothetical protein